MATYAPETVVCSFAAMRGPNLHQRTLWLRQCLNRTSHPSGLCYMHRKVESK